MYTDIGCEFSNIVYPSVRRPGGHSGLASQKTWFLLAPLRGGRRPGGQVTRVYQIPFGFTFCGAAASQTSTMPSTRVRGQATVYSETPASFITRRAASGTKKCISAPCLWRKRIADELMFSADHLSKATIPLPLKVRALQAATHPGRGEAASYSPQISLTVA